MATKTAEIKNEFYKIINDDIEYSFDDMKKVLRDIFKIVNKDKSKKRNTPSKKVKKVKKDHDDNVVKKAPSAYNLFIKEKIVAIRTERPDILSKDRMSHAAEEWKKMSDDEKEVYKTKQKEHLKYIIDMNKIDAHINE